MDTKPAGRKLRLPGSGRSSPLSETSCEDSSSAIAATSEKKSNSSMGTFNSVEASRRSHLKQQEVGQEPVPTSRAASAFDRLTLLQEIARAPGLLGLLQNNPLQHQQQQASVTSSAQGTVMDLSGLLPFFLQQHPPANVTTPNPHQGVFPEAAGNSLLAPLLRFEQQPVLPPAAVASVSTATTAASGTAHPQGGVSPEVSFLLACLEEERRRSSILANVGGLVLLTAAQTAPQSRTTTAQTAQTTPVQGTELDQNLLAIFQASVQRSLEALTGGAPLRF